MSRSVSNTLFFGLLLLVMANSAIGQVCTIPPAGMVSWWSGDGDALDITGSNDGTLVGATFAPGKVDQAFSVASGAYVEVPDDSSLDLTSTITIDAWVYVLNITTARVLDKITAGDGDGYLLDILEGHVRLLTGVSLLTGDTALPINTWVHIAGTFDGSNMRVYVNGVIDGIAAGASVIPTNDLPLRIGADSNGENALPGLLDEIELFDRALSGDEILAIFEAGTAGKCKHLIFRDGFEDVAAKPAL